MLRGCDVVGKSCGSEKPEAVSSMSLSPLKTFFLGYKTVVRYEGVDYSEDEVNNIKELGFTIDNLKENKQNINIGQGLGR